MSEARLDELLWLWSIENYAPATQKWRKDLTPEEAAKVAEWDANCDRK